LSRGTGNGKGKLVEREKFLEFLAIKTELSLKEAYVVTYGLKSMGSHANQWMPMNVG
jgi:hypothetical protein